MLRKSLSGAIGALMLTSCATTYSIMPVDTGTARVTYENGKPTTDLELEGGAVKITPLAAC